MTVSMVTSKFHLLAIKKGYLLESFSLMSMQMDSSFVYDHEDLDPHTLPS